MSPHEQEAKVRREADSRPAFGTRQVEARAYLTNARRQLEIGTAALEDARRALNRREVGGADWQVRRALERIAGAQAEIVTAFGALTVEEAEPGQPF